MQFLYMAVAKRSDSEELGWLPYSLLPFRNGNGPAHFDGEAVPVKLKAVRIRDDGTVISLGQHREPERSRLFMTLRILIGQSHEVVVASTERRPTTRPCRGSD